MAQFYYLFISFGLVWLPFVINRIKRVRFYSHNTIVVLMLFLLVGCVLFLTSNILFYERDPRLLTASIVYLVSLTILQTVFVYFGLLLHHAKHVRDGAIGKYWGTLVVFGLNIGLNWIIMGLIFHDYDASNTPSSLIGLWAFALIIPAYLVTMVGMGLIVFNQVFWVQLYRCMDRQAKRWKKFVKNCKYILT